MRTWTWDPLVIFLLAASGALYAAGVWRMWRTDSGLRTFSWWQVVCFATGWMTLVLALVSPLHRLGSMLFAAHMAQHELLMLIAAPLLVMGRPLVPMLRALPMNWRASLGAAMRQRGVAAVWRWISGPLVVWLIHGFTLWVWHAPSLYQATLNDEFVHALQHTSFLFTALLFWYTLIHGRFGRMGYGAAVLYIFTTGLHSSILGALMTFTPRLWYPIYNGRTAPWHMTPIEDQQLGGLIMWIPAGTVFVVVGLALFAAWLGESERRLGYSRTQEVAEAAAGRRDAA